MDMLKNFEAASQWASEKIAGATDRLNEKTPCEEWDVKTLVDHMCDSQQYFTSKARGEDATLPSPSPPQLVGDDPVVAYKSYSEATLDAFRDPDVQEKEAMGLGISFVDQLVHGWDVAKATGQDATMPKPLAQAAWTLMDGNLPDDKRGAGFKPAIATAENVPAQDKLLAYTGRNP